MWIRHANLSVEGQLEIKWKILAKLKTDIITGGTVSVISSDSTCKEGLIHVNFILCRLLIFVKISVCKVW